MAYSLLRYYYFLEDDQPAVDVFCTGLKPVGFNMEFRWSFLPDEESKYLQVIKHSNMQVLVLGYKHPHETWDGLLSQLEQWEKQAELKRPDLLGVVTVFCSSQDSWEAALQSAHNVYSYGEAVPFGTAKGQLARLDWKWPLGYAHYLFAFEENDSSMDHFFSSGLPIVEASLIKLNMISNLYRDRNKTILVEQQDCDKRLSRILHTQLVSQQATLKEVEEMEEQVRELSSSYGILVGDYSLVSESRNLLNDLLSEAIRQIKGQRFLVLKPDLMDTILNPYQAHQSALSKIEDDLRSSWKNHQAAIDVVRSRIDIMISRENIETQAQIKNLMELNTSIQEQSLTFQVAAGIIEFIVLAYYSHSLWKGIAHNAYAMVSPWIQFAAVMLFSGCTVVFTHLLAEYKQGKKHVKRKLIMYSIALFLFLAVIITVSAILEAQPLH